ncbi:mitochondrial distribution/morphology family 35/apoptosis [Vararia minispora EC-137]|uniref:Mitochondrial distribution/morphology family 35/apoptosis n=1 Tax=Vararia minispora EC-137 TaxID=1314806 RepID=A0ACB8QEE2_9AGAM|nr:mitochondrial distribution/morphology family 35/apoptosis [Vararia minispora EC-137]
MAHSLSAECTPLKLAYDACFNSWFEGYLEPAVIASADAAQRAAYSRAKAEEFERKCGAVWVRYRECVQKAVREKGLTDLLEHARKENPLKDLPPAVSSSPRS